MMEKKTFWDWFWAQDGIAWIVAITGAILFVFRTFSWWLDVKLVKKTSPMLEMIKNNQIMVQNIQKMNEIELDNIEALMKKDDEHFEAKFKKLEIVEQSVNELSSMNTEVKVLSRNVELLNDTFKIQSEVGAKMAEKQMEINMKLTASIAELTGTIKAQQQVK